MIIKHPFKIACYVVFLCIYCSISLGGESTGYFANVGEYHSITSGVMKEDRQYMVQLPVSYNDKTYSDKRYPVLYLLDGNVHMLSVSGVTNFMSAGLNFNLQIPELIIVAIPNTNRMRDLSPTNSMIDLNGKKRKYYADSGGADLFLDFIEKELIPHIDETYRTIPHRTIVGHSLGGLLAIYSLIERPDLFQGYIAADPSVWWDNNLLINLSRQAISNGLLAQRKGPEARLYISGADHLMSGEFNGAQMVESIGNIAAILGKAPASALSAKYKHFSGESHGSVPLQTLYYGLKHIFSGYEPPREIALGSPEKLAHHFQQFSKKMGYQFLPPGNYVDQIGALFSAHFGPQKACGYFSLNADNYPRSARAQFRLAEVYRIMREYKLARKYYRKSLAIDPDNAEVKKALTEFK